MTKDPGDTSSDRFSTVVSQLKQDILLQRYKTGQALPKEDTLRQQFNVSRPLMREALRELKAQGYLEAKRGAGGGTFVLDVMEMNKYGDLLSDLILAGRMRVKDLCEVRLLIEPEAARLAALKATDEELEALRRLANIPQTTSSAPDRVRANVNFHVHLAQCCQNPFMTSLIRSVFNFTDTFLVVFMEQGEEIHDDAFHERILECVCDRDPSAAFEQMFIHVAQVKEGMIRLEQRYLEMHQESVNR